MAEPFGDQDEVGSGKRPAPTIEGTATEISTEPAPGGSDDADSAEHPAEETASGMETPEADAEAAEAPPRTSGVEFRSFLTHLAAGLLGGLVGVLALAFAWKLIPARNADPSEVSAVKTRLDKLEAARPATGDPKALAALDGRVKSLETRSVDAPDLSGLTGRVTSLEDSWRSLAKTAEEGGSVAEGAALDARVNDMEQRLQGSVAGALDAQKAETAAGLEAVQGEVTALKAKLGALAEANLGSEAELGPDLTEIDHRLAKLEGILPALSTTIDRSAASARSGAFAIAFANLRDAVSAGRPFAAELAAVQALHPETQDLGDLGAHAGSGIPTVPELAQKLQTLAQASLTPPPPSASESFVDSVIASAKSAISVRRIDAAAASGEPGDVLARAEAALKQGDLAAAMQEIGTLPAPSRDAFTGWLDDARARIAADETLGKLESTVLLSLSGADGAAEKP
ncbi:MAG: mitofilin family membrane protein [Methyloceanibacter sp.]|jgi:hypothetical protein